MERVRQITDQPLFRRYMEEIRLLEENRIYCSHTVEHGLDVARIAWIRALEQGAALKKDVIYAAALLHDIGRADPEEGGANHSQASVKIACEILKAASFDQREQEMICRAILGHSGSGRDLTCLNTGQAETGVHREAGNADQEDAKCLAGLIYYGDKASRMCFLCRAKDSCKWPAQMRNDFIRD